MNAMAHWRHRDKKNYREFSRQWNILHLVLKERICVSVCLQTTWHSEWILMQIMKHELSMIMMWQQTFINGHKRIPQVGGMDDKGGYALVQAGAMWTTTLLYKKPETVVIQI